MTDISITAPSAGVQPAGPLTIEPQAKPYWGTALSTACKGYQEARYQVVKSEIWPDGAPSGLHVSVRNRMLAERFKAREWDPISDRHLQRLHGGR